ncbi:MAG TPA: UTP--glucose-1-phosphate uridylyltransferase GalU [Dehalococcoidia bacterium]|nr:UTP--glucose-1-phosphate uridylyltransferase GalU [Dehalococcoidia bacterium]
MKVRKAVILAAGYGTRFLPATKAVPKEMLPLVDRPVIQYIVEEAVAAGLHHIVMVTSAPKRSIEDYFDREPGLEQTLAQRGKHDALRELVELTTIADFAFVRQKERLGNGHAVLITRNLVGQEPFALFFPDDVIVHEVPATRQLLDVYEKTGATVVAVQEVAPAEVEHYGVIDPEPVSDRLYRVKGIIEKPRREEATSNLATVGRFVLTPRIFDVLAQTPPGREGELWLMDALHRLAQEEPVYAYQYEGERFDTGRPMGLLKASIALALRREDLGPELKAYLKSLRLT